MRYGVKLYIADPACISVSDKEKYMETLHISVYQLAVYVVARWGPGFQKFKVTEKKKKAVKKIRLKQIFNRTYKVKRIWADVGVQSVHS